MFGLDVDTLRRIREVLARFPTIDRVLIYGSRAKGNYRRGSDIDLTILGRRLTRSNTIYPLSSDLDDLDLPYTFDLSAFADLQNPDFIEHILRVGKVFYECPEPDYQTLGWQVKPLGEICTVGAGNSAPQDSSLFDDGTFPFFRTADVGRVRFGEIVDAKDLLNERGIKGLRLVPKNTILMPKSGASTYLNHRVIMGVDGYVASHLATLSPKEDIVIPRYLLYAMSQIRAQDIVQDQDYPSLSLKLISKINIPLPPIAEQRRIVALLDKALTAIDVAIAKTKEALADIQDLVASKMKRALTPPDPAESGSDWQVKRLGEVCSIDKTKFVGADKPYVGLEDISSNSGIFIGSDEPAAVKSNSFAFDCRHVLYGRLRPYLNKALVPDFDGHCSTEIFPLLPSSNIDRSFLFYWITSRAVMRKINDTCTGTRMPRANMKTVLRFDFPLPPIAEQRRIVKQLDELTCAAGELERVHNSKLANLEELRQSLLQQAFAGRLTGGGGAIENNEAKVAHG